MVLLTEIKKDVETKNKIVPFKTKVEKLINEIDDQLKIAMTAKTNDTIQPAREALEKAKTLSNTANLSNDSVGESKEFKEAKVFIEKQKKETSTAKTNIGDITTKQITDTLADYNTKFSTYENTINDSTTQLRTNELAKLNKYLKYKNKYMMLKKYAIENGLI